MTLTLPAVARESWQPKFIAQQHVRLKALSPNQRRLVEIMQGVVFGTIDGLVVRRSEPTFDPIPRVTRDLKIGGENSPRPQRGADDFELKDEVKELLQHLSDLPDDSVVEIEVRHGLPVRVRLPVQF